MSTRFVVALVLVVAAGCGDERSRREQIREEALQRLESRPMRTDVSAEDLRDANIALAEDIASIAEEAGEPPTEAEQAAVAEREAADRARFISAECTRLAEQGEALQRLMQDPEPLGGEPVDVAAVQAEIAETQSRLNDQCR